MTGDRSKKLVTWKNWVLMIDTLVAGAGYHVYRDSQADGGQMWK